MTKILNSDGQPINSAFNGVRNRSKFASSLRGILLGIAADTELNETELLFLSSWLESQGEHTGDILDLYEEVKQILEDQIITTDELKEIHLLINDCIEYGNLRDSSTASGVNEFFGLMEGIVADNIVNRSEFDSLEKWVTSNSELSETWPISAIKKRIVQIWEDDIVTDEELSDLCEYMKEITGTHFTEEGDAVGGATEAFDEHISFNSLKGLSVCHTGKFLSGTRNEMNEAVVELDGIPQKGVTKSTDVVVIGTLSSTDWIYTSAGRKIEKALKLRQKGSGVIITSEKRFTQFCNSLN